MSWFLKIIRIAGVNFPVSAMLVQFQAELDADKFENRLKNLEDPMSSLHEDVSSFAAKVYSKFKSIDSVTLEFDIEFYTQYGRVLALIETKNIIGKNNAVGSRFPLSIKLVDPSFILYMACKFEDINKMQKLLDLGDHCKIGETINAEKLSETIKLPKYLIRAVFEIYEDKGFGYLFGGMTKFRYTGKV